MVKAYTSKPPKSAHAARAAWRYFEAKFPTRKVEQMQYRPGGQYAGENGWMAHFEVPDGPASAAYVYDYSGMTTKFVSSREAVGYWSGGDKDA